MVSLSDTSISLFEQQTEKIKILLDIIKKSKQYKYAFTDATSPTGDGVAICFQKDIKLAIDLAIEVQKKLRKYNQNKPRSKRIDVRIGISSGTIFKTRSLGGKQNYWGPGITYAHRIMSCGISRHILLDDKVADELTELEDKYKKSIHYVGETTIKHGKIKKIYSAYGNGFGNKTTPNNILTRLEGIEEGSGRMIYESVLTNSVKNYLESLKIMKSKYLMTPESGKVTKSIKRNIRRRGRNRGKR